MAQCHLHNCIILLKTKRNSKNFFQPNFISEGLRPISWLVLFFAGVEYCFVWHYLHTSRIALGLINDKNGIKMSKHLGNVITPNEMLMVKALTLLRWYFCSASAPGYRHVFRKKAVEEAKRNFMGTLWNTYYFFVLYANIDKFNPKDYKLSKCKLSMMDKWILE